MSQEDCEGKLQKLISGLRGLFDLIEKEAEGIELPFSQLKSSVYLSIERLRVCIDKLEEEVRKLDPGKKRRLCEALNMTSIIELVESFLATKSSEEKHSSNPGKHLPNPGLDEIKELEKEARELKDSAYWWGSGGRIGNYLTSFGSGLSGLNIPFIGGLIQLAGDALSSICGTFESVRMEKAVSKQMDILRKKLEVKIDKVHKDLKGDLFKAWKYLEANMANLDARIVKVKKQLEEAIVELEDELYKLKCQLEAKIDELDKKIEEMDKRNEERLRALKDQLETKVDGLKKQLEDRLNKLEEELRGEFSSLRKQLDGLTRELTDVEKEVDGLKKQLDDVRNQLGGIETRLMTTMDALERRLRMNVSAISSSLKGLSDKLDADLIDIRKRMESLRREVETIEELCEELKKLLEETSSEASGSGG